MLLYIRCPSVTHKFVVMLSVLDVGRPSNFFAIALTQQLTVGAAFFVPLSCFFLLQLSAKIPRLQARITLVVFNYIRRGLVEKDKLIVASVMALRILRHEDKSGAQKTVEAFVSPGPAGDSVVYPEEARR